LIGVQRDALAGFGIVAIETVADAATDEAFQGRGLGRHVHVAAGAAAPVVGCRALDHFDLFNIEDVATVAAVVPRAVDKDAAAGVEAAQAEVAAAGGETVLTRL